MNKRWLVWFSGVCLLGMTGLAFAGQENPVSQSFSEQELLDHPAQAVGEQPGFVSIFRHIRQRAILEAAESYGSQAGYCAGVQRWNRWADQHASVLDGAYDFTSLLLDGGRVLPPIVLEDSDSYRQSGRNMAVTAQTTWEILHYGRIVSVAPTWRNYLLQTCAPPLKPNPVLLPKSPSDWKAWRAGIRKGWAAGEKSAREGFLLGLHRMTRDYAGMLRFWLLHKRGVVSAPVLSTGEVGVRVHGRTLSVGERIFRLTSSGGFQVPGKHWKPVLSDPILVPDSGQSVATLETK